MNWIITIVKEQCTGCGECVESCPGDVFQLKDSISHPTNIDECHGCHTCEDVCEEDAVSVTEAD